MGENHVNQETTHAGTAFKATPLQREFFSKKREVTQKISVTLDGLVSGAAFRRDQNLVEYVTKLRKRMVIEREGTVPQRHFLERPGNLFWIEGTSLALLYNYIPRGQANVYQVAYANPLVNLTRLQMALLWARAEQIQSMNRCMFVCEKAHVFTSTDLVHTRCPELAEKYAERISFFADKYR